MKAKTACEEMYKFTKKSGEVANWIAVFLCVNLLVSYVGHHVIYSSFANTVCLALLYAVLSVLQYIWQGVTCEIYARQLDKQEQEEKSEEKELDVQDGNEYWPSYIANGGWFFYMVKMIVILAAVVLFIINMWS